MAITMVWDRGPPRRFRRIFERAPLDKYKQLSRRFRLVWGPMFYRGRLDGKAKILIIGQDPAADENVAHRIFVGHAGQRIQGYLSKLGIARSYIMINSFLYSIRGQFDQRLKDFSDISEVKQWRNDLFDELSSNNLQAIIAFGLAARYIVDSWPGANSFKNNGQLFYLMHPTARSTTGIMNSWNSKLNDIANQITPDSDGQRDLSPYQGKSFRNYTIRIPLRDFGFGVPKWMGEGNMAVRLTPRRRRNLAKAKRTKPTILWIATNDEG